MKDILKKLANSQLEKFRKDEDGAVIAYIVLVFLLMVVASGSAIDYMRHETMRTELQSGLDRGLLAATSLNQTLNPEDVVSEYLKSAHYVASDADVDVTILKNTTNERRVQAIATVSRPTFFLRLIGVNDLSVTVKGAAMEGQDEIEISLVLDLSTSMDENNKIANLRSTAKDFIDQVVNSDTKDHTTMTIVPYAGQVNVGATMFTRMTGVTPQHNYSHCIEFADSEFGTTALDPTATRAHMPHFRWSGVSSMIDDNWAWCPQEETSILAMSNDANALKGRINSMGMHEATGIQYGLKWGLAFLDPSMQTVVDSMIAANEVDSQFQGRPKAHTDGYAKKFLVLMSDGKITQQFRVNPSQYVTAQQKAYWTSNIIQGGNDYTMTSQPDAQDQMNRICNAARAQGIRVFTIGFETSSNVAAETALRNCASNASDFFSVDGLQIGDAFDAIAQTIQKLKLVY